jgi:hypothetical protein
MIQRLQTLYLSVSILFLSTLLSGFTLIRFTSKELSVEMNAFGTTFSDAANHSKHSEQTIPFFIALVGLIALHFVSLITFKKLKTQLRLAKIACVAYIFFATALLIVYAIGEDIILMDSKAIPGVGFFVFLSGIPFSFLAVKAIKKDKALIDSVDRIR